MGIVLYKQGKVERTYQTYLKALKIYEQEAPKSLVITNIYNSIGLILESKNELDSALPYYCNAGEIYESKAPGSLQLANTYINVGVVLRTKRLQKSMKEKLQDP
jgi:tetratricopeptide (TPR) repeat protein